jgi:hypothetical protein
MCFPHTQVTAEGKSMIYIIYTMPYIECPHPPKKKNLSSKMATSEFPQPAQWKE